MNRAFRDEYRRSDSQAVLLPACLKRPGPAGCAAERSSAPFRCLGCSSECRIGQIDTAGRVHGFEVIITPHESDAFQRRTVERLVREHTAIVGVACALNLLSGGWRATSHGIPAQCVILDYCGCRGHWDEAGFPTDLNIRRLHAVLNGDV